MNIKTIKFLMFFYLTITMYAGTMFLVWVIKYFMNESDVIIYPYLSYPILFLTSAIHANEFYDKIKEWK